MSTKDNVMNARPLMQEIFASRLYKRNQGKMVRQITALTLFLLAAVSAWRAHTLFIAPTVGDSNRLVGYLLALLLGGVGCWIAYRLVHWPKFADFLISVEAELNKVSWPTQRELVRASIVVMFTIVLLSAILFGFDALWKFLFGLIGIA